MSDPTRVVVAVDGSRSSDAALQWAAQRAERSTLPLVLVHVDVSEVDDAPERVENGLRSGVGRELLDDGLAEIQAWELAVPAETVLIRGSLWAGLQSVVTPQDLLVMGTNKMGYLNGRSIGSRSLLIAGGVAGDVAVIPSVDVSFRRGVVAGVDRWESVERIAQAAADEAHHRGGELLIVHATLPGDDIEGAALVDRAVAVTHRAHPELNVRTRLARQHPSVALLDAGQDGELIVLGPGSVGDFRAPIGAILHDVLLNAPTPVLVVRCRTGVAEAADEHARAVR